MKIKLLIFLGLVWAGIRGMSASADIPPADGWTAALDEAIGAHKEYVAVREARIETLRQQLARTDVETAEHFRLNAEIYQEYKAYICDSALCYLSRNLRWAQRHEDREATDETLIRRAHLMSAAGMYKEASEDLEKIVPSDLPARLLPDYYECFRHLYNELGMYTQDTFRRRRYYDMSARYNDSLMQVLSPASAFYLERQEMKAAASGQLEEALKINDTRLANVRPDTPEYALVTYHRSLLYHLREDREQEKYYLALSALADIRLAITDHASLWTLAQLLYEEGDIERAYRYIRFSWSETNHYLSLIHI